MSADDVFFWANWILVAALVLGVVATWAIVVSGNARDKELKRELAEQGRQAAEAIGKAALLEKEAAVARLETERIKKQAAWRGVSVEQQQKIREILVAHPMQISIAWTTGDPESSMFAVQLRHAFISAGSDVIAFAPFLLMGQQRYGLMVSGSKTDELSALVAALKGAELGPISISASEKRADGMDYATSLFVGYRNPPNFEVVPTD